MRRLLASHTAEKLRISNEPGLFLIPNLVAIEALLVRLDGMEGLSGLVVTSGYRSPALNRAVGGSPTSAHVRGLAADLAWPGQDLGEKMGRLWDVLPNALDGPLIELDQVIWEKDQGIIHLGFAPFGKGRDQWLQRETKYEYTEWKAG